MAVPVHAVGESLSDWAELGLAAGVFDGVGFVGRGEHAQLRALVKLALNSRHDAE
jgi:hypothetical protein